MPDTTSQQLYSVATEQLLPAARSADFVAFGEGLYRYGYQAGMVLCGKAVRLPVRGLASW